MWRLTVAARQSISTRHAAALVLLVDRDALRGAGRHRSAPVAHARDPVEDRAQSSVANELAPEGEGVLAHRACGAIDDELLRGAYLGAVDVADRRRVERVEC